MSANNPNPNPNPNPPHDSLDHISTRHKGKTQYSKETPKKHQTNDELNIENSITRPKCSSFHSKKDFKFQGHVNSEHERSYSKLSIDTENDPSSSKFQKVNIFNNLKLPDSPKIALTLKKSFSSQRPSVVSSFSSMKKKAVLKLSNEEDFKVF